MTKKPLNPTVSRQIGVITPAMAAARKAARLEKEAKTAAELNMVEHEIGEALKNGDHQLAAIHLSLYKTVSKNQDSGKSREIQLIDAGFVYHSTYPLKAMAEMEVNKIRKEFASFSIYKNVNGFHVYVLPIKGI